MNSGIKDYWYLIFDIIGIMVFPNIIGKILKKGFSEELFFS